MAITRGYLLALVAFLTFVHRTAGEESSKEKNIDTAPLITILRSSGYSGIVRITCIATGIPKPTISWLFNGDTIEENEHYNFKYENQSLLSIKDTTFDDSGKYRCVARNYFGSIFGEIVVKIKAVGSFIEGFQDEDECQYRNVTVGRPYELQCPPHTVSYGQQYTWVVIPLQVWKAGYPIERIFQSPNGSLIFSYVKNSDISLISRNGGLSCGLVVDLHIIPSVSIKFISQGNEYTGTSKPSITVFMEETTIGIKGKSIKLLCGATGKPHPDLTWFKDGKKIYAPLDTSLVRGQVSVEGKGMVLLFRTLQMSNAGTYKCVAENPVGQDSKEGTLIVNSNVRWVQPLVLHQLLPVRDPIKLECIADGKPEPTYTWMQNETEIISSPTRKITGGLLEITKSDFNDAGFYLCIAENYINTKVTASYVDVQAFPPSFVTNLQKTNYFFTGDKNTLHCDVTGGPLPRISWYFNEMLITHTAKLAFDASSKTHNGIYKCNAGNVEGDVEGTTVVKVFDRTRITVAPSKFSFTEGSVANLFCEAEYDKTLPVTYEWLKNGKLLSYDERVHLKIGINWRSTGLQIDKLLLSDVGTYTCRVFTNDDATFRSLDEKTGSITVIGTPRKPQNVKLEGDCNDDEIKLAWSEPSKFIGPVNNYIVEYSYVDDSSKWYEYKTESEIKATSVTLKTADLPSSASIIFRVSAVSIYGDKKITGNACEGTKIGSCVIGSGVPFAPPMGLQADMDAQGNLTVSWDKLDKIFQAGKGFKIVGKYKKIVNGTVMKSEQVTLDGDDTSFTIPVGDSSPYDDAKYEITVRGENEEGPGPESKIIVQHPSNVVFPFKVENVEVVSVTADSVTLKWDEMSSASGYMIYYTSKDSRRRRRRRRKNAVTKKTPVESKKMPAGDSGTIDGLESDKKYDVAVAAVNLRGEGPTSDPIEVQTKEGVPGIPKSVDLKTYGKAIVLAWSPPEDDKGVTGYDVTWYPSDENDPDKYKTKQLDPNTQQTFITSDLEPLRYYTVELRAKTGAGKGKPWRMEGVVVGKPDLPGKPDPPKLVGLNISIINASFQLPTLLFGGLPSKFHVYYVKKGESDRDIKQVTVNYPEESSALLLNLDLAVYRVWTVAENGEGKGQDSDVVEGMPLSPTTPPPPLPATSNQTNITVVVVGERSTFNDEKEFYSELWFIILIAIILLIIILLLIICAILNKSGGKYPVGDKEKKFGGWDNQQLQDYSDNPMEKPNGLPFKDSKAPIRSVSESSIAKVPIIDDNDDEDNDSLDYYGEDNKFVEDGSFIGEYGDDKQSYTNNGLL